MVEELLEHQNKTIKKLQEARGRDANWETVGMKLKQTQGKVE